MKDEYNKMLAGELYDASDPYLVHLRFRARELFSAYNQTAYSNSDKLSDILYKLLGARTERLDIQAPFYCDYGINTFLGHNVFINFNCTILDVNTVHIGDNTMLGPSVQIYTASHPLQATERIKGPELGLPIVIGNNVWIGGGVIICPNVTIGDNTTIGAGSVVTKDIPANVFAAGNPCRVIKAIS